MIDIEIACQLHYNREKNILNYLFVILIWCVLVNMKAIRWTKIIEC